jgi:hypothetical protein
MSGRSITFKTTTNRNWTNSWAAVSTGQLLAVVEMGP